MTNTPPAMSSKAYQPHSSPYLLTPMEDLFSDVDEDDGQPHHHVVDVQHAPTHAAHTPIPSRSDLYGARRAQTSSATTRKNIIHSPTPTPPPTTSSVVVPASSSSSSSVDAHVLIAREAVEQRLEATEELFDARVRAIDETFAHAGKHIVDRDDLIHVLQKQVADLQAQLRRAASAQPSQAHAAPNAHRWTRMTNKTSPTTTTTTTTRDVVMNAPAPLSSPRHVAHDDDDDDVDSLHQRVRFSRSTPPLRSSRTKTEVIGASCTSRKHHHRDDVGDDDEDAAHNNNNNNKSSKQTIELLTQQLRDSERRRRRDKKSMTQHIHKLQNTYQEQLQQLHDDAERVAQQRAERQRGDASLEHLRGEAEAHALTLQMELDDQRTQHTTLMAHMRAENTQLRERVASMEMSLVRLLRLMSAVPSLKKMLSWNEIDASFAFVGYTPTNNIHDDDDDDDDDVHVRANTTGLVDGVYGGTTSATDTKNIWLNNNTNNMNVLHGLVDEVSAITRARRMKLQRHECAAQLPSGEDVLACRQRERDYWVPRAAFDVAQVFRDTSCRDVPMSDFYNFLLALNRVWGDRVRERVDVLRREVKELKQKHIISAVARDAEEEKMKMMMQQQQQQQHHQQHHGQAATLIDVDADGIRAELDELRSIVRTTISSRRTLALIRRYDHLLRRACGWKRTTDAVATQQQQQQQQHIDAMMYDNIIRPAHLRTHDERRGSMLGATASKARATQRHVAASSDDDEDAEWIDDDDDDEYQQQHHHHHRRRPRPRHRDARNTQQAESSVEALLCIVEHTCERVRVVSGDFDEQLRAGCDRLRHLTEHISQLLRTAHNNNNNTVGGSSNTSGVATTEMGARVAPLQQEISALLRQKYSTRAAPTPTPTSSTYADEVLLVCGEVLHVISALVHESAEAEEAIRLVAEDAMVEAEHIG